MKTEALENITRLLKEQSEENPGVVNYKGLSTTCFYLARYCRLQASETVDREYKKFLNELSHEFENLELCFENVGGCP